MAKIKKQPPSPQTQEEALAMAKATQRPGQSKEQTKMIAQGIEKGIDHYKKQQKAKAREKDKQRKKEEHQTATESAEQNPAKSEIRYRTPWLPWALLLITWAGIGLYILGLGLGGLNESMANQWGQSNLSPMAARFMLASSRMAVCRRPPVSKNRSVPVSPVTICQS